MRHFSQRDDNFELIRVSFMYFVTHKIRILLITKITYNSDYAFLNTNCHLINNPFIQAP